jgi:antitoxin (DNA-binding transcriptional repressor) of toxin-antitoxin stability system
MLMMVTDVWQILMLVIISIDTVLRGEEVIITKDNSSVVKIVPTHPIKLRPQFGSAKGLITMSDDFDEPLEDFKEYME